MKKFWVSCWAFIQEELSDYDREAIVVLNLNVKGKLINASITSLGTLNSSIAHPREVFKTSILSNAASIILMHNHPNFRNRGIGSHHFRSRYIFQF